MKLIRLDTKDIKNMVNVIQNTISKQIYCTIYD